MIQALGWEEESLSEPGEYKLFFLVFNTSIHLKKKKNHNVDFSARKLYFMKLSCSLSCSFHSRALFCRILHAGSRFVTNAKLKEFLLFISKSYGNFTEIYL